MAVLNDWNKKASEAKNEQASTVQQMSDITRLNIQISDEQRKLDQLYANLGKEYTAKHALDAEPEFAALVQEAVISQDKIDDYHQQILEKQNIQICPNCGAQMSRDSVFCTNCGTRLIPEQGHEEPELEQPVPEKPEPTEPEPGQQEPDQPGLTKPEPVQPKPEKPAPRCSSCGKPIMPGTKFCIYCGRKLTEEDWNPQPEIPETEQEQKPVQPDEPTREEEIPGTKICPQCHSRMPAENKFCTNCGFDFSQAVEPQPEEKTQQEEEPRQGVETTQEEGPTIEEKPQTGDEAAQEEKAQQDAEPEQGEELQQEEDPKTVHVKIDDKDYVVEHVSEDGEQAESKPVSESGSAPESEPEFRYYIPPKHSKNENLESNPESDNEENPGSDTELYTQVETEESTPQESTSQSELENDLLGEENVATETSETEEENEEETASEPEAEGKQKEEIPAEPQLVDNRPNYCTHCGWQLRADDLFCPHCGKKIETRPNRAVL